MYNGKSINLKSRTQLDRYFIPRFEYLTIQHEWEVSMREKREKAIAQAVGKAIAKKRIEKGLTQENVAEKLNIGYEAVSRIERGIVTPNIVRLVELAEIFDCEMDELLMNAALRPADHARHLQELFEPLSEQDRVLLMNIVTSLAERLRKDGSKN